VTGKHPTKLKRDYPYGTKLYVNSPPYYESSFKDCASSRIDTYERGLVGAGAEAVSVKEYVSTFMTLQCVTKAASINGFSEWACDCKTFAGGSAWVSFSTHVDSTHFQTRSSARATH
jgi:hypothetical protein